ncbi:MAG: LysR family transcriptional regulator [Acidobacteriaceae bacterium]
MHASVLSYFIEVARCGSIRKAARNLYVASSAVNRQILNLEKELNTELFVRLPTGIRLTPAGERVLVHVRSTMKDFQEMRMELDALRGERTGHITVAALDSLFFSLLPATVLEFAQLYPAVTYSMAAVAPQKVTDKVSSGDCEIGITFFNKSLVGLKAIAKVNFSAGVVMDSAHPLTKKTTVTPEDCRGYSVLRVGGLTSTDDIVSSDMANLWNTLVPAVTCNSTMMLKHLVMAGHGLAFLSKVAFLEEIANGTVVWRPFAAGISGTQHMAVVVSSLRVLSPVTRDFVQRLIQRMKQMEAASVL